MRISFRNLPKFLAGGVAPEWYKGRYKYHALKGWTPQLRYDYSDNNLLNNGHRNAGDLSEAYKRMSAYTSNKDLVTQDIQSFYDSKGNGMTAELFRNYYNGEAAKIRGHWSKEREYNTKSNEVSEFNRRFRQMFKNRSNQNITADYNIGYLDNQDNTEGSSTWLRRMDLYENLFDGKDTNRIHKITLSDGKTVEYYKKLNGDIELFDGKPELENDIINGGSKLGPVVLGGMENLTPQQIHPGIPNEPTAPTLTSSIDAFRIGEEEQPEPKNNWLNYIRGRLPEVLEAARLAGNLANNQKVYDATRKGVKGNYLDSYHTYTQLLGDEATKLGFYRRATQGETLAARPFTSDADRYMAYRMESKRIGDELRALGDLADNQEIRRTSEKSEEHTNANIARDNQVENANIAERNKVASTLARLEAEKYAADWTNIDNYLMGTETRWRLKIEEYKNSLKTKRNILYQLALENDKRILNKTDEFNKRYEQVNGNPNDPELQRLSRELRNIKAQITMEYMDPVEYIKNGSKITYTKKDDLLYKTIRDSVEHFRKMTKMADDSAAKHRTKVKDLILPPKSKTRKMLLGGIAPFTVFKPVVLGGSTTMLTSSTGNISGSDKESGSKKDEQLEFVKKLFQEIALLGKGIPIDISFLATDIQKTLNRASMLGTLLTSDLLQSLYVASMNKVSLLPFSLDILKNAEAQAKANGALGEYAVTSNGNYVAMDTEGHLREVSLEQLMSKNNRLNPLTNNLLIYLRNITPEMALQKGDNYMLTVVANGIGVNKINSNIREYISGIGVDEIVKQGYTRLQAGEIKKGLEGLMEAPDGDYKVTLTIKTSERQGEMALDFIVNSLQDNELAVLKLHAAKRGMSVESYIGKLIGSKLSTTSKLEFDAVTGKASDKDKKDTISATFNDLLLRGQVGVPREFSMITKDENTKLYSLDAKYISQLPKVNSDMSVDRMLAESEVGKILDSRLGITFGDQVVNPENLKDIMFSVGGGATVVTLPCKYENGHKVVNFAIKDEFDEAIKKASESTPIDWTDNTFKLNLANILKQKGLDSLLTTGMLLDPNMLGQFLVVEGYSTDRVKFNKNSKYVEKVSNPTKELEERLNLALSTKGLDGKVLKYDVDINDWGLGFLFEGGWDDIYHANVFIPLNNDPISALIGSSNLNRSEAKLLASEYLNYLKLIKAKNTNSNLL